MKTNQFRNFQTVSHGHLMSVVTAIALFAALTTPLQHADAAIKVWNVALGNWDVSDNWLPSGVPTFNDTTYDMAYIDVNRTALVPTGVSGGTFGLYVGSNGIGTLTISGGAIADYSCYLGSSAGSVGTVNVSSGSWSNTGWLTLGYSGTGKLALSGGLVSDYLGMLGDQANSLGSAVVSGGTWNNARALIVGNHGNGSLDISGGLVTGDGLIGTEIDSIGAATVSGGTWNNPVSLYVGASGRGTLNLTNSGIVTIANGLGTLNIAAIASGTGTLNVGTGGTAGMLNAGVVTGGGGTAVVNFNHTGGLAFAPQLTGRLAVNKLASGTTVLSATNTYTGATKISSGRLALGVNGSIRNSTSVTISPDGVFDTTAVASGTFVMQASQKFTFTLDPSGSGSAGLLDASGLDITNGVVDFATLGTLDDPVYVIAEYTSLTGNSFATVINLPDGYFIDYDYNNGTEIAVVPEPSSFVLMGLGLAGMVLLRRKK